jgi:glycosyltransferase involved in cell wall biosynthesis
VNDDELAAIYTGAHALVFPSDEEGFGLPPVEALACGTPVAACDVPALREVLGGRAQLAEVGDLEGLIRTAESLSRPAPSAPTWSWRDAAAATWTVYTDALRAPAQWRGARRRAPGAGEFSRRDGGGLARQP